MGFYYGQSGGPPPEERKPGWAETFGIVVAVFRVLALPLGIVVGVLGGVFVLIWLFTVSIWLGLAVVGAGAAALVGWAIWEWRHPTTIDKLERL